LTITALYSCNKFLDEKADSSLVVPNSLKDLQALMDGFNVLNLDATPGLIEMNTDDFYVSGNVYNTFTEFEKEAYSFAAEPQFIQTNINLFWKNPYTVVFYANVVLDRLQKLEDQEGPQYRSVKGQALFFRAYTFFQLAQVYCMAYKNGDENFNNTQLGLPLRLLPDFEEKSVRSTLGETYGQIVKDLEVAVTLLPDAFEFTTRPSKAAALALLARVNLSMEDYGAALDHATAALQLKSDLMDYKSRNENSTTPFEIMNPETIFSAYCTSLFNVLDPAKANVDKVLYRSYGDDDARKVLFFLVKTDGTISFKGNYAGWYNGSFFSGLAVDELYLIKAECQARLNQLEAAKLTMKTLLDKRYRTSYRFPHDVVSQDNVLAYILGERRKELLFRGIRWTDIKRLNRDPRFAKDIVRKLEINGQELSFTMPANDPKNAFVFPQDVIAVTGMEQNSR
jgi:hypothetical protein